MKRHPIILAAIAPAVVRLVRSALLATVLGAGLSSRAAVPEVFLGGPLVLEAQQIVLDRNGTLSWKGDGSWAPSGITRIRQVATGVEPPSIGIVWSYSGDLGEYYHLPGAIAADRTSPGRLWCVAHHGAVYKAAVNHPGGVLDRDYMYSMPDASRISFNSQISNAGDATFATDETGEFLDQARLWHLRSAAEGGPELVADRTSGSGQTWFRALYAVHAAQVVALQGDEKLVAFLRIPVGFGVFVWVPSVVAERVVASALMTSELPGGATAQRLVWAVRSVAGTEVNFRSAPLDNLAADVNLGTDAISTLQPITGMAAADGRLFYQLAQGAGGPLLRRSATGFQVAPDEMVSLGYEARSLVADARHVFWTENGHTIWHLPVGAAAVTRDIAATTLEVIQAIQRPANDVPCVADKPTYVRVMAYIASSDAGETSLTISPSVTLHGTRGGMPLPGSPLLPSLVVIPPPPVVPNASPPLRNTVPDRASPAEGYWFRLPDSWATEGTVALTATVNPSRVFHEVGYANNVLLRTITFTPKVPVGLKIIPTLTNSGTTRRQRSDREILVQASAMMPTSELRWEYCHATRVSDVFGSPFTFFPGTDDKHALLINLQNKKIEGAGATLAEPGGFDHYMSLLPQVDVPDDANWGGWSSPGDTVSAVGSSLIVVDSHEMSPDGRWGLGLATYDPQGTRFSAVTLAHEIAHNYGRMHVAGCLSPDFPDPAYPYAGGTISDAASGHLGFNGYTRRLLPLLGTGDIMTYCFQRWVGAYTWPILYNRLSTGYGPALHLHAMSAPPPSTAGFTTGVINRVAQTSTLRPVYALGTAEQARAAATLPAPGARFVLRAYGGATLKSQFPAGIVGHAADAGDDVDDGFTGWAAMTDGLGDVDRIELHDLQRPGSLPLATRTGGGTSPVVAVTAPAGGAVTGPDLHIQWTSTDDGAEPLVHFVRLSIDSGATWRSLASEILGTSLTVPVADLPGGVSCIVDVIASDGILCGRGVSAPFSMANKAPEAAIVAENDLHTLPQPVATTVFQYGERMIFHAEASDAEDGWLPASSLSWTLGTTPPLAATGRRFQPADVPPGMYPLALTVNDSAGLATIAACTVIVRPAHVEAATSPIVIDGYPGEAGYSADVTPKAVRFPASSSAAHVRWVEEGGSLCLSITGLPRATPDVPCSIVLNVSSAPPMFGPDFSSLRVDVEPSGATMLRRGTGVAWGDPADEPGAVTTSVSGDATRWNVEVRFGAQLFFSGFTGSTARIAFACGSAALPASTNLDAPISWMPIVLGPDTDSPTDTDGDSLPDSWELTNFGANGSPGGSHDSDFDGSPDAAEYIAGTSPTDPASRFVLSLQDGVPGTRTLAWTAAPDRTYIVWRSPDLIHFIPVAEGLSPAGSEMLWTDPDPPADRAFYRAEVLLPR